MSEDGFPNAQPWNDNDILEEDDEDPRELVRSSANVSSGWRIPGGKAPRHFAGIFDAGGDSDGDDEALDLGAYFEEWDLPPKQQAIACRSYASYISQVAQAKKKRK